MTKVDDKYRRYYERKPIASKRMKTTPKHNQRIATMTFTSVYPHYIAKVEKKGRTKEELHDVIKWLRGFDEKKLQELIDEDVSFEVFFQRAAYLATKQKLIVP